MKTAILPKKSIAQAANFLKSGDIIAFPTETVYGLGARIFDEVAIQDVFRLKGRPSDNPLIAHIASPCDWTMLSDRVPETFHLFSQAFFPGALTLIVAKNVRVPSVATGGLETVAIRCPDHPVAQKLIQHVQEPLVAPSANLSGRPSSTTAEHVFSDFEGAITAILDGGPCLYGLESTVVDLVSFDRPTIVRPGAISKEALEAVAGRSIELYTQGPKSSPGMKYRHYSPRIPVYVFSQKNAFEAHLLKSNHSFSIPSHKLEGKTLYALLRHAEQSGYADIAIDRSRCTDMALINRLEKMQGSI